MATQYLDYEGLKSYNTKLQNWVKANMIEQLNEMPEAGAKKNIIVQYIGVTNDTYTSGFFYESKENTETGAFTWVNINVQPTATAEVEELKTAIGKDSEGKLVSVKERIKNEAKDATYSADKEVVKYVLISDETSEISIEQYKELSEDDKALYKPVEEVVIVSIKKAIENAISASVISIAKQDTADEGYLATYTFSQNGIMSPTKINIPKDFLVKDGKIVEFIKIDDEETGDSLYYEIISDPNLQNPLSELPDNVIVNVKYLELTINVAKGTSEESKVFIAVNDLVDAYTSEEDASEVQITINDNNVISAVLNTTLKKKYNDNVTDVATLKDEDTVSGSVKNSIKTLAANAIYSSTELIIGYKDADENIISVEDYEALTEEDKVAYSAITELMVVTIGQAIKSVKDVIDGFKAITDDDINEMFK